MATGPRFRLPPGSLARRPPRHSILTAAQAARTLTGTVAVPDTISATPQDGPEERWAAGLSFEGEACGEGATVDPCGPTDVAEVAGSTGENLRDPYLLVYETECTTLSRGDTDIEAARALRGLNVDQHRQVGTEFWRGTLTDADADVANPALTNNDCERFNDQSSALSVIDGLAAVEDFLAGNLSVTFDCLPAGLGMIHASPYMVTIWQALRLVIEEGGLLRTVTGNIVVTGPGYDGSAPDGTVTAATEYVYATGLVSVWLGSPRVLNADRRSIDRETNLQTVAAERAALATFDCCCHLGQKITRADRG